MRVKKFTCINCGAPKINEYRSPYIVCDYCGSFTDIDYTLGLDFWKEDPAKTAKYQLIKISITSQCQKALQKCKRDEYYRLQYKYWDDYYRIFPAYLPPSIDTSEEYGLYLNICAGSSTKYAFDKYWTEKNQRLSQMQHSLTYYSKNGMSKVHAEPFFEMAEYFIDITKEGMQEFYDNPEYEIMHELLPQSVHLKMKLSMFVQVWLPYLTDEEADRFLKITGFSLQYVELEKPTGEDLCCEHCSKEVFAPGGSYKVYCENCHKTTRVKTVFDCMSCGAENKVQEFPAKPVDCAYCGTENRLIKPLFG